jgi:hypothetical protein
MFNALEGDGVIENIYHFLWTKDTIFNSDPSVYYLNIKNLVIGISQV